MNISKGARKNGDEKCQGVSVGYETSVSMFGLTSNLSESAKKRFNMICSTGINQEGFLRMDTGEARGSIWRT